MCAHNHILAFLLHASSNIITWCTVAACAESACGRMACMLMMMIRSMITPWDEMRHILNQGQCFLSGLIIHAAKMESEPKTIGQDSPPAAAPVAVSASTVSLPQVLAAVGGGQPIWEELLGLRLGHGSTADMSYCSRSSDTWCSTSSTAAVTCTESSTRLGLSLHHYSQSHGSQSHVLHGHQRHISASTWRDFAALRATCRTCRDLSYPFITQLMGMRLGWTWEDAMHPHEEGGSGHVPCTMHTPCAPHVPCAPHAPCKPHAPCMPPRYVHFSEEPSSLPGPPPPPPGPSAAAGSSLTAAGGCSLVVVGSSSSVVAGGSSGSGPTPANGSSTVTEGSSSAPVAGTISRPPSTEACPSDVQPNSAHHAVQASAHHAAQHAPEGTAQQAASVAARSTCPAGQAAQHGLATRLLSQLPALQCARVVLSEGGCGQLVALLQGGGWRGAEGLRQFEVQLVAR